MGAWVHGCMEGVLLLMGGAQCTGKAPGARGAWGGGGGRTQHWVADAGLLLAHLAYSSSLEGLIW